MSTTSTGTAPAEAPVRQKSAPSSVIARLLASRPVQLVLMIVVLIIVMTIVYPTTFPTALNLQSVALGLSTTGILVVGMMLLLVAGQIDLSIGANVALTGAVTATLIVKLDIPTPLAIVGGLAIGGFVGLVNGLLVTRFRINSLIATLATTLVVGAAALLVSGQAISPIGNGLPELGQGSWLGIQYPFWFMIVIAAVFIFLVAKTPFFRQLYFIGGNERAAILSGMRAERVQLICFVIMGLLAGVAGILRAARFDAAQTAPDASLALNVLTAAVIGGAALTGGEGRIIGGVLGVILLALVQDILVITNVNVYWQDIVTGLVLIAAVLVRGVRRSGQRR